MVAIPLAFFTNVILGVVISNFKLEFNYQTLFSGIRKGLMIYISIILLLIISFLVEDIVSIEIADTIKIALISVLVFYVSQSLKKLNDLLNTSITKK